MQHHQFGIRLLDTDVEQVMAWKEGKFVFNNTNIQGIMRQEARWYDIEVVFEGKMPEKVINGEVSRYDNATISSGRAFIRYLILVSIRPHPFSICRKRLTSLVISATSL